MPGNPITFSTALQRPNICRGTGLSVSSWININLTSTASPRGQLRPGGTVLLWGFSWASFWVVAGRCCGQLTGLPRRRPRIYRLASKRLPPSFSLSNKHSHRTTRRPSKPSHRSRRRPNDYPTKLERWTVNLMPFSSPLRALSSNLPLFLRNFRQHPQKEGADASDF